LTTGGQLLSRLPHSLYDRLHSCPVCLNIAASAKVMMLTAVAQTGHESISLEDMSVVTAWDNIHRAGCRLSSDQ